jgi:tetratricopeptide (TPR) repeat protein
MSDLQDINSRLGLHERSLEYSLKIIQEKIKDENKSMYDEELRDDFFLAGTSFAALGEFNKALNFFQEAYKLTEQKFSKGSHPELANTLMHIGNRSLKFLNKLIKKLLQLSCKIWINYPLGIEGGPLNLF